MGVIGTRQLRVAILLARPLDAMASKRLPLQGTAASIQAVTPSRHSSQHWAFGSYLGDLCLSQPLDARKQEEVLAAREAVPEDVKLVREQKGVGRKGGGGGEQWVRITIEAGLDVRRYCEGLCIVSCPWDPLDH